MWCDEILSETVFWAQETCLGGNQQFQNNQMSNNFLASEAKNNKKGKTSKTKQKGKKVSNTIKIKSDNNELHVESDEEYEETGNKKVKTETNSVTKIIIPVQMIFTEPYLQDSLALLRSLSADTELFENNQESLNQLRVVIDYKYRSQKVVFTKDIFERKLKNGITPSIFTRKNLQIRLNKPKTPNHLAFENYLNLVAQLYYKATHQLVDINAPTNTQELFKSQEEEKPIIQIDQRKRPGRKAKPKPLPQPPPEVIPQEDPNGKSSAQGGSGEGDKGIILEEGKTGGETAVYSCNDVMDSLVSPLRTDFVFEKWSPKEIAIFEAGLCKYGKEFNFIQYLIRTKTINQVIEFYFAWKNTSHYKIWKHYKNIENKSNYNSWL